MKNNVVIILFLVCMMAAPVLAAEIGGVNLPDSMMVGNENLILNGAGLRKKLFVKVYAGGLYLKAKSSDYKKIIDTDEPMVIRMQFIHDGVSSDKLIAAWNEGFENATAGNITPIKEKITMFNSFFKQEAKKGDIYDIFYTPGQGISVNIKGTLMGTIPGFDFKKAVFAIWLGDKPADSGLKSGMLGK